MTPTIEILERVNRNSQKNKDEVFTKLYRYMLRPDIYYVAYKNLPIVEHQQEVWTMTRLTVSVKKR